MFSAVLGELTGLLGNRFKLNAFFPALVACLLGLLLGLTATIGLDEGVRWWAELSGLVQVATVVLAVAVVYTVAAFLDSQSLLIVRVYEGYVGPLKWWGADGREWHEDRYARLFESADELDVALTEYALPVPVPLSPPEDEVERYRAWKIDARQRQVANRLPTRLGNVLRSGEQYANERYGTDALIVWPRLLPLVPEGEAMSLSSSRASMEQLLILSFIVSVFATAGGIVYAFQPHSIGWSFLCLVGGWAFAGLLYRAAVDRAVAYSLQLKAIFDTHRLKVLDALAVPRPRNRVEEKRRWSDVTELLAQNSPDAWWAYTQPAAEKKA